MCAAIAPTLSDMIPLAIPNLEGNEARYLQECIETNFVSSVGPFVDRFEGMIADACGTQQAVATSSGTSALHVMLAAMGVKREDLVIMPALTFIATANAVSYTGAEPVFLDVSSSHWTLDPIALEAFLDSECEHGAAGTMHRASGRSIRTVLCVHTLGHPCDMDGLLAVTQRWGIPLVSDAAAAIGARYRGKKATALGFASTLSFNGNKTITCGGGGAVVSGDADFLKKVRHLSTTARVGQGYDHDQVGFNYRMTNIQAAVGCAQMERVEELVAAKRRISRYYLEALGNLAYLRAFDDEDWADSAAWLSGFILAPNSPVTALDLVQQLNAADIGARTFWKPIHLQPPYADCIRGPLPICEGIWHRVVTLPCSTNLPLSDQDAVINAIKRILVAPSARPIPVPGR